MDVRKASVCAAGISEADYPPEIVGGLGTPCSVMNRVRDERERERERCGGGAVSLHAHAHAHTTLDNQTHTLSDKTDSSVRLQLLSWFYNETVQLNQSFIEGALLLLKVLYVKTNSLHTALYIVYQQITMNPTG